MERRSRCLGDTGANEERDWPVTAARDRLAFGWQAAIRVNPYNHRDAKLDQQLKGLTMADQSEGNTNFASRPAGPASTAGGAWRLLGALWKAFSRIASARTAGELNALADRYQMGQPALAADLRAAAVVTQARGA